MHQPISLQVFAARLRFFTELVYFNHLRLRPIALERLSLDYVVPHLP